MKRSAPLKRSPLKPSRKRIKVRGQPRFKQGRDPAFLGWMRGRACMLAVNPAEQCEGITEAAHVKSRGAGGVDFGNTVPLCSKHHAEQHTIGIQSFERKHDVLMGGGAANYAHVYAAHPKQLCK